MLILLALYCSFAYIWMFYCCKDALKGNPHFKQHFVCMALVVIIFTFAPITFIYFMVKYSVGEK